MNVQEALLRERIDPHLDDATLSRIAGEALGAAATVRGHRVLTGGCWNRVLSIDASGCALVIKVSPRPKDAAIIREFATLAQFRKVTALPVPTPLLLDAESRFTPGTTLVMSRLPGAVMHECFGLLDSSQRRRLTEEIAEHVATLHMIRSTGFGGVELEADRRAPSWPEFWLPRYDRVVGELAASGAAPPRLVDAARDVRPHLGAHLDIGAESTMTHYDIWSGNVMLDLGADPPRVSGFIDVPGYFADYARELSFALLFGVADQAFLEVYSRRHAIDEGFPLRASIYNLKMNLRHIQMYPTEAFYRRGAERCLAHIQRHLARGRPPASPPGAAEGGRPSGPLPLQPKQ